jgi:16S rRNA U516 pseudouridylate synthase RsuA-like enzyme
MFDVIHHSVTRLVRVGMGPLTIEGIEPGKVRALSNDEISALKRACGLMKGESEG